MKLLVILTLLFSLAGCSYNSSDKNSDIAVSDKEDKKEETEEVQPEVVYLTENGSMSETAIGSYELVFDGEKEFKVHKDYIIDRVAIEFDPETINLDWNAHLSGEFRYTYAGKEYIVTLNTITIGFYYMGKGGNDSLEINTEGNVLSYWMRSTDDATFIINKVWQFVPFEEVVL